MKLLCDEAELRCQHQTGKVRIVPTQYLVRIEGEPVLVKNNPEDAFITGCSNVGLNIKPCTTTLKATDGYSTFVNINGNPVCLDTVEGLTDGTPPGVIKYLVHDPGQDFVKATE